MKSVLTKPILVAMGLSLALVVSSCSGNRPGSFDNSEKGSISCAGQDPTIKILPSLVEVIAYTPDTVISGSGFIIDSERGYIITAQHVVSNAESIIVAFRDDTRQEAQVDYVASGSAGFPATADIALITTQGTIFPALQISEAMYEEIEKSADSASVPASISELFAVASIDGSYLTMSGPTLSIIKDNGGNAIVQFNARWRPGMSGSPVVDRCGMLVGIASLGSYIRGISSIAAVALNPAVTEGLTRRLASTRPAEGDCPTLPELHFPTQGSQHIEKRSPAPTYKSNPPTSGPHWSIPGEAPAPWGAKGQPLPDQVIVHNLELGGIAIHYRPNLLPAMVKQLQELIETHPQFPLGFLMAPREDLPAPITLSAWEYYMPLFKIDQQLIDCFIGKHYNQGPKELK